MDATVTVDFRGDIAVLRMNTPENRMNLLLISAVDEALDRIERSNATALVTIGTGKFYSNGMTAEDFYIKDLTASYRMLKKWNQLTTRMLIFPMPTVAAINGKKCFDRDSLKVMKSDMYSDAVSCLTTFHTPESTSSKL
uniref:Uncharacterized protein LOC102805250 n=1 Tax=Saccoglossus kowalevskii TaxID=10224 RepID=A0ABM0LX08_SACKO|nr:PREDICTED: uncharacterized protein LOC102805250 [Saccoglossus kowalevskii]